MTTETSLVINGRQAALYYNALATAILVVEDRMTLKSAEPFKQALALQIAAYKGEMVKLATTFPELT